jgi:hypothetical protein
MSSALQTQSEFKQGYMWCANTAVLFGLCSVEDSTKRFYFYHAEGREETRNCSDQSTRQLSASSSSMSDVMICIVVLILLFIATRGNSVGWVTSVYDSDKRKANTETKWILTFMLVYWVAITCGLVGRHQRFDGTCWLHLQGWKLILNL